MYALLFSIAIGLFTMFMIYKSIKKDYIRYGQTKSLSSVIGWVLFGFTTLFVIVGIIISINYERVAPFSI